MVERVLAGKLILLCEDHPRIGKEIAGLLRDAAAEVAGPFASVAAAIEFVAANHPDITAAILDCSLPDGSSFELAKFLRGHGVAVVFHTAAPEDIPVELAHYPLCMKPAVASRFLTILAHAIAAAGR